MSDERIKQKIKKLLELGRQSTFPNEAQSARNQALALMRRYNLSEKDLHSTKVKVIPTPEQEYAQKIVEYLILRQRMAAIKKAEQDWLAARKKELVKETIVYVVSGILIIATVMITLLFGKR